MKNITENHPDMGELIALYERSFPANERRPARMLFDSLGGHRETVAFYEDGRFLGFAVLLNCNGIAHIIYFAVEEAARNQGLGSRALAAIHQAKRGERVIVDIERENKTCANPQQRERRKRFYLRNGYQETDVKYRWHGEDYEILSYGGNLTEAEFGNFWDTLEFVV